MKSKSEVTNTLSEIAKEKRGTLMSASLLTRINNMLKDPATQGSRLAAMIELDPMLTALTLKASNSSIFGLVKRVTTVKQAISVLGFEKIQNLVLTNIVGKMFDAEKQKRGEDLWKHSLGTAVAAEMLAEFGLQNLSDNLFTIGMLHDIGTFIIYTHFEQEAEEILKEVQEDPDHRLLVAEKHVLNMTHAEIGAYLAAEWSFPEFITQCIRHHHFIFNAKSNHKSIATVMLANNIAKGMELGASDNPFVEPPSKFIWSLIRIPEQRIPSLVEAIHERFHTFLSNVT